MQISIRWRAGLTPLETGLCTRRSSVFPPAFLLTFKPRMFDLSGFVCLRPYDLKGLWREMSEGE